MSYVKIYYKYSLIISIYFSNDISGWDCVQTIVFLNFVKYESGLCVSNEQHTDKHTDLHLDAEGA